MAGYLPFRGLSVTWGSWQFDVRFMFRAMTIFILKQTVVTLDLRHGWACSTQSAGFEMVSTCNLFENHQFLGLICIKEPSRSKGDWRETMIPRPNSSKYGVIWNPGPWQEWVLPFPFDREVFILSKQGMRINLHLRLLLGGGANHQHFQVPKQLAISTNHSNFAQIDEKFVHGAWFPLNKQIYIYIKYISLTV